MRVDEKTLRRHLQREAIKVPLPDDMWQNISSRLDAEQKVEHERKRTATRLERWKPALAFAAAAGIFWMAVIPSGNAANNPPAIHPVVVTEAASAQPQSDVLVEVSRYVKSEKPAREEVTTMKFGFSRLGTSVQ